MRSLKFLITFSFVVSLLALASPAEAGGNACFTWQCGDGLCQFDASCSTADPYVWKYRMDYGDGTSSGLTGNSTFFHDYGSTFSAFPTLTIYFFTGSGEDSVTCEVFMNVIPVGPQPPSFGTCS